VDVPAGAVSLGDDGGAGTIAETNLRKCEADEKTAGADAAYCTRFAGREPVNHECLDVTNGDVVTRRIGVTQPVDVSFRQTLG